MISLINHDSSEGGQRGRYNLPIYINIWDYGIIMGLSNGIHSIFESGIMIQRDF
jgi:hypothetical protein